MKTGLVLWSVFALAATALGQGQFVFNNRALPEVNAPMTLNGVILSGSDYTLQLFGGPSGSAMATWTELGATTFRTGNAAGYVNPITVTVPGATSSAELVMRVLQGTSTTGTPFARLYDLKTGSEPVFSVPVAVAPNPPPTMALGTSPIDFENVPEPSTCSLFAIGVFGLILGVGNRRWSRGYGGPRCTSIMNSTLILALALLLARSPTALGQGQFVFNNRALPDTNARFVLENGVVPGSDTEPYAVQLFGGPTGSPQSTWTELGTTTFRTANAAGYVSPITVTVPGATTSADLLIRIYPGTTTGGSTYYSPSWGAPEQVFTVPVAVAPNPPPNLQLGTSSFIFHLYFISEPLTCALVVVGMLAMLLRARNRLQ